MKTIKFLLSIGNILFGLNSIYMAHSFYTSGQTEQTIITLFFTMVSFSLFLALTKSKK